MHELGRVVSIEESGMARVSMDSCGDCAHCGACKIMGSDARVLVAKNGCNAKVGDRVEVAISAWSRVAASMSIFFVPMVIFFSGFAFFYNKSVFGVEAWAALAGLVLVACYYFFLFLLGRRRRKLGRVAAVIVARKKGGLLP